MRPQPNPNGNEPNQNSAVSNDRRARMIQVLTESVLRGAAEDGGPMVVLLRMVRERDGNIDALVRDFERRAQQNANDLNARLALGHLYREAGRFEDAIREYTAAERAAPTNAAPPRALADIYHRMDRGADERAARERALSRTTDRRQQADALRQLMELALAANDVTAARGYHTRLVALDRNSLTGRRELADALLNRRMFAAAIEEYESVVRSLAGDNRVLPPVLRDLGKAYAGANQHERAVATYRRALSVAGADAGVRRELYDAMTESFVALNQLGPWIQELERESAGRDSYERAVLLGRLHDQAGNAQSAIRSYQRAIASRPTDVDAQRAIAQLYRRQGMRDQEIAAYRRLVQLAPRETDWVIELAELLINAGRRDEAFAMLADCSRRAGNDPTVHERLAEVYARFGRSEDSLRETELVARLDPQSPVALAALGRQYWERDQRDLAMATWRRILNTSRDRARGALALGNVYFDNGMLAEASEMFQQAVASQPENVEVRLRLAEVLERMRQFEPAIQQWRQVLERTRNDRGIRRAARQSIVRLWQLMGRLAVEATRLQALFNRTPPDVEAGRDLAEVFIQQRQWPEAEGVLARIVRSEPGDVVALESLERVQSQRGNLAAAIETLRRLCDAEPRRARDFYQRMAQHALALHRDADALEFATRAVQLNDQDATAHLRLAEMYRARGDVDASIASLRRAIELNDRLFPTYFELADLYLGHRGAARDAVALYRRVIVLASDDEYVLRAGRRAVQIAPAAGVGEELERDLANASAAQPTRGVFRRLLVSYYDAAARPLINRVRQGTAREVEQARAELSRMGARALAPLLDALGDSDGSQQQIALDILGFLGNPNASSALITLAENHQTQAALRHSALLAAGALGDPRVYTRLVALTEAGDTVLSTIATWGIAHIRTRPAQDTLVRLATGPSSSDGVRMMASLGLANVRDARVKSTLRAIVEDPRRSDGVRAAAAYALGSATDRETRSTMLAAVTAGPMQLRAAAAAVLGASEAASANESAEVLSRALFAPDLSGISLRRVAARALARLASPDSDVIDRRAFDDPMFARSGDVMLRALLDPVDRPFDGGPALHRWSAHIARSATDALGGLQERAQLTLNAFSQAGALLPLVSQESSSSNPATRAALERLLTELAPAITQHATHPQVAVRRAAVAVLASTGAAGIEGLARAAQDDDEAVAGRAIEALRPFVARPEVEAALAGRLDQEVAWPVRAAAAGALRGARTERARTALLEAVRSDPFAYVRIAAAQSLRAFAAQDGPEALSVREALARIAREDADPAVRAAAAGVGAARVAGAEGATP
ncbi:MAG: tetratricopeptide repeat protein [Myxococcales bacterium]|nr:tetratricopeptide repeat protein [Myxococcales bacterium]